MFITFEGLDFCGKSTQVNLLEEYLLNQNKQVKIIREPGGTIISEKVRSILLDKKNENMFIETEILLFSASRAQLVREVIKPFLDNNYFVISDRFHDSTTAYQGFGRLISLEFVTAINRFAIGEAIPDVTFLIDIPITEAKKRKTLRNSELDRIELSDSQFYEKVRGGYLSLAKQEKRIKVINGLQSIDQIHNQIIDVIKKYEQKGTVNV